MNPVSPGVFLSSILCFLLWGCDAIDVWGLGVVSVAHCVTRKAMLLRACYDFLRERKCCSVCQAVSISFSETQVAGRISLRIHLGPLVIARGKSTI